MAVATTSTLFSDHQHTVVVRPHGGRSLQALACTKKADRPCDPASCMAANMCRGPLGPSTAERHGAQNVLCSLLDMKYIGPMDADSRQQRLGGGRRRELPGPSRPAQALLLMRVGRKKGRSWAVDCMCSSTSSSCPRLAEHAPGNKSLRPKSGVEGFVLRVRKRDSVWWAFSSGHLGLVELLRCGTQHKVGTGFGR